MCPDHHPEQHIDWQQVKDDEKLRGKNTKMENTTAKRSNTMKTAGLLGGMSWESTALYYRLINEGVRNRLGGLHSARIAMISVDFQVIEALQSTGDWQQAGELLAADARRIEMAGADFLLLCTNTMHKVADRIQQSISIPLVHLADATADTLVSHHVKTVGLLGTRFTMEEEFYRCRIGSSHDIDVLIPSEDDIQVVHRIIFDELCKGVFLDSSRRQYLQIINDLHRRGAEGVILGCTEIGMLIHQRDTSVPLYDTTAIHAAAAIDRLTGISCPDSP